VKRGGPFDGKRGVLDEMYFQIVDQRLAHSAGTETHNIYLLLYLCMYVFMCLTGSQGL